MTIVTIRDLNDLCSVPSEEAALVKGGPLEIRELTIRVDVKDPKS